MSGGDKYGLVRKEQMVSVELFFPMSEYERTDGVSVDLFFLLPDNQRPS